MPIVVDCAHDVVWSCGLEIGTFALVDLKNCLVVVE